MGIDPVTHRPRTDHLNILTNLPQLLAAANFNNLMNIPWADNALRAQLDATKLQLLQNIIQVLSTSPPPSMEASYNNNNNLLGSNIRDQQLYEYLRMDSQLEGLLTGGQLAGFAPHDIAQIQSNFPNLETSSRPPLSDYCAPLKDSKVVDDQFVSSYAVNPSSNTLPPLVLASPDQCSTENQMGIKINPNEISNHSSTSTSFEVWADLMDDDEASDINYWRDIIE